MTPVLPSPLRAPGRALVAVLALLLGTLGLSAAAAVAAPSVPVGIPTGCGELDIKDTAAVKDAARNADDVFVGRVVGVGGGFMPGSKKGSTPGAQSSPSDPGVPEDAAQVRHHVIVSQALVGDLVKGDPVRLELVASAETDPTRLRINRTYLLFTKDDGTILEADACEGWVLVSSRDARTLRGLRSALAEPPPTTRPEVALTANPDVDGDGPALGRILAPGGALALLGVLGLVLVYRIGRARP